MKIFRKILLLQTSYPFLFSLLPILFLALILSISILKLEQKKQQLNNWVDLSTFAIKTKRKRDALTTFLERHKKSQSNPYLSFPLFSDLKKELVDISKKNALLGDESLALLTTQILQTTWDPICKEQKQTQLTLESSWALHNPIFIQKNDLWSLLELFEGFQTISKPCTIITLFKLQKKEIYPQFNCWLCDIEWIQREFSL